MGSIFLFVIALVSGMFLAVEAAKPHYIPKEGYVPDAKTAIKIAVAVWEVIYGEKILKGKNPLPPTSQTTGFGPFAVLFCMERLAAWHWLRSQKKMAAIYGSQIVKREGQTPF